MKKMKQLEKSLKNIIGKEGTKFLKNAMRESISPKTASCAIRSFIEGIKKQKEKNGDKQLKKDIEKFNRSLSSYVVSITMLLYNSQLILEVHTPFDNRFLEIKSKIDNESKKIIDEILSGKFDFIHYADESNNDDISDMIDDIIVNRLIVAAKLTPGEMEAFLYVWNEFKKECAE